MEWIVAIYESVVSFFEGIAEFLKNARLEVWEFLKNPVELLNQAWDFAIQLFYEIVNTLIEMIGSSLEWSVSILPDPFSGLPTIGDLPVRWLNTFNWVFPTDVLITSVNVFIVSTVLWMTLGIITRWLKITV